LDGAADPLSSVPATCAGKRRPKGVLASPVRITGSKHRRRISLGGGVEFDQGILAAYASTHDGFSLDHLLADPDRSAAFAARCQRAGLTGGPVDWNRTLLRIRKTGKLPRLEKRVRTLRFAEMDGYSFASEVAMQRLGLEHDATLDGILTDPRVAAEFDAIAAAFSPGFSPFQYRWAALAIRKRAKQAKKLAAARSREWAKRAARLTRAKPLPGTDWGDCEYPGVYLLADHSRRPLYVGETLSLRGRLERIREIPAWRALEPLSVKLIEESDEPYGLQSFLIGTIHPVLNSHLLVPDLAVPGETRGRF
jgi:site-specific DNA-methyltransferase (adenine-specific)